MLKTTMTPLCRQLNDVNEGDMITDGRDSILNDAAGAHDAEAEVHCAILLALTSSPGAVRLM